MNLEHEIVEYIKKFRIKDKGSKSLKNLLEELSRTEKILDGYSIKYLSYEYNRQEVRLLSEDQENTLIARFDIFTDEGKSILRIGYYDYVVNFKGEFIDEFLVFEKEMKK